MRPNRIGAIMKKWYNKITILETYLDAERHGRDKMFSVRQKREISEKVQRALREIGHPELPKGEINFTLHVQGKADWSYADIHNNSAVDNPSVNPWNEQQDKE